MKNRKYPFGLFLVGLFTSIIVRRFWLFIPGLIFAFIGWSVVWCRYASLALLGLDVIISLIDQLKIWLMIHRDSDNPSFREFQDLFTPDGKAQENIINYVENKISQDSGDPIADWLTKKLRESVKEGMSLPELVDCFEKMCEIPIKDSMILFETGTYDGQFWFSMARQLETQGDEYMQIHMIITYAQSDKTKILHQTKWDSEIEGNIFDYIRSTLAYALVLKEQYTDVVIWADKT